MDPRVRTDSKDNQVNMTHSFFGALYELAKLPNTMTEKDLEFVDPDGFAKANETLKNGYLMDTPQDWREEAVDEIVDEHPWIYRLEEALVNEDKYHYCEVDATDLKFTIKHYRRLQNLLTTHTTELIAHLEDKLAHNAQYLRKPQDGESKFQTKRRRANNNYIKGQAQALSDIQGHLRSNNK